MNGIIASTDLYFNNDFILDQKIDFYNQLLTFLPF